MRRTGPSRRKLQIGTQAAQPICLSPRFALFSPPSSPRTSWLKPRTLKSKRTGRSCELAARHSQSSFRTARQMILSRSLENLLWPGRLEPRLPIGVGFAGCTNPKPRGGLFVPRSRPGHWQHHSTQREGSVGTSVSTDVTTSSTHNSAAAGPVGYWGPRVLLVASESLANARPLTLIEPPSQL